MVPFRRRQRDLDIHRDYDNPFALLTREMNRFFDDFRSRFELEPFGWAHGETGSFLPSIDVTEDDREVRITSELPGIDERDIDVSLSKDSITVKGEKKQETEDKDKDYYRMERSYGSFQRTIPLPAEIDQDKAQAEFKKGVLRITLPKTPSAQKTVKKVEVTSG
jgi:HSP20 family protein